MYYIPLKMSETDYEKFINKSVVKRNFDRFSNKSFCISNPYFYKVCRYGREFYYYILSTYSFYLSKHIYEKYRGIWMNKVNILDLSESDGDLLRHFRKMGCNVYSREKQSNLSLELDKLQHCENHVNSFSNADDIKYDIAFISGTSIEQIKNISFNYNCELVVGIIHEKFFEDKYDMTFMSFDGEFIGIHEFFPSK